MDTERLLVAGDLSDCPLDNVLGLVSLSRQGLRVVLEDDGGPIGAFLVKSGQLLEATAPPHAAGAAAFGHLYGVRAGTFEVYRADVDPDVAPLGRLPDLVAWARRDDVVLASGSLGEVDLEEVLASVDLSRRSLVVEISDGDGVLVGRIAVKAGHVLEVAHASGIVGIGALGRLLSTGRDGRFRVYPGGPASEGSLGRLAHLLREAPRHGEDQRIIGTGTLTWQRPQGELWRRLQRRRGRCEVVLTLRGDEVGRATLGDGQLLSARHHSGAEGVVGFEALGHSQVDAFTLYAVEGEASDAFPIGHLDDLCQPTELWSGTTADADFEELLGVVALSAQHLEISAFRGDVSMGSLRVKGGQLLCSADRAPLQEIREMRALLADAGDRYTVSRVWQAPGRPCGRLVALVAASRQRPELFVVPEPPGLDAVVEALGEQTRRIEDLQAAVAVLQAQVEAVSEDRRGAPPVGWARGAWILWGALLIVLFGVLALWGIRGQWGGAP